MEIESLLWHFAAAFGFLLLIYAYLMERSHRETSEQCLVSLMQGSENWQTEENDVRWSRLKAVAERLLGKKFSQTVELTWPALETSGDKKALVNFLGGLFDSRSMGASELPCYVRDRVSTLAELKSWMRACQSAVRCEFRRVDSGPLTCYVSEMKERGHP